MDGEGSGDEIERRTQLQQHGGGDDDRFVWDDNSHLYYHARSGFYHDPNGGWYYNTSDGLYYKFEDGNYVLFDAYKDSLSETCGAESAFVNSGLEDSPSRGYDHDIAQDSSVQGEAENVLDTTGLTECRSSDAVEEEEPTPTSEWLEDTLIDLYLSGYSRTAPRVDDDDLSLERDERGDEFIRSSANGNLSGHEREESEWDYGDHVAAADGSILSEGTSWEEENWKAQYGQVIHQEEESLTDIPLIDLWDWALVKETKKDANGRQVTRLVGRLVQPTTKLHPSMPAIGGRLKTAPICQVHLDLVRVKTGQVYKLRSPSVGYLATLSSYDSSNPTKEWGFPELSVGRKRTSASEISKCRESKIAHQLPDSAMRGHAYRDRAAERRALHGGFGVGPGQRKPLNDDTSPPSSPTSVSREKAAAEALDMSLGAGSFAHRMLKNMGWKEGEALGKSRQGLKEPLQAVGNKGSAGLGWPKGRMKGP